MLTTFSFLCITEKIQVSRYGPVSGVGVSSFFWRAQGRGRYLRGGEHRTQSTCSEEEQGIELRAHLEQGIQPLPGLVCRTAGAQRWNHRLASVSENEGMSVFSLCSLSALEDASRTVCSMETCAWHLTEYVWILLGKVIKGLCSKPGVAVLTQNPRWAPWSGEGIYMMA